MERFSKNKDITSETVSAEGIRKINYRDFVEWPPLSPDVTRMDIFCVVIPKTARIYDPADNLHVPMCNPLCCNVFNVKFRQVFIVVDRKKFEHRK